MQLLQISMGWVLGLGLLSTVLEAAILPLTLIQEAEVPTPMDTDKFGYLEVKPNGSLILRRAPNQSGSNLQNLLLLRGVLQALKLSPTKISEAGSEAQVALKLYGDGVELKFPPFLENVIQRIQTYFSVYRYTDTSKPNFQRKENTTISEKPEEENTIISESVGETTLKQEEDSDELTSIGEQDAYITVGEDSH
ncbi:uncharacterized protein Dana_GF23944 [Drosophila ananassae]|uniref:DUF4174 domain-containing protein n=1 Tax=Drosophila ananassae TaxID=7217 RepID=B3M453_DROAN|nr:uncharacterized protein LOC6506580 [Drosophila ananassae]EDV40415.1 uncharacterized protein Dana_GF23944 [Drosophila ananassae]